MSEVQQGQKETAGNSGDVIMPDVIDDGGLVDHIRRSSSYSRTSVGLFAGAAIGWFFGFFLIGLVVGGVVGYIADSGLHDEPEGTHGTPTDDKHP